MRAHQLPLPGVLPRQLVDDRGSIRRLERELRSRRPIRQIAADFSIDHRRLHLLVVRYGIAADTRRHIYTDREKKEVIRMAVSEGLGVPQICRRTGISQSTVYEILKRQRNQPSRRNDVSFRHLRKAQRCPAHGLITTWPCVACEASRRNRTIGKAG